MGDMPPCHGCGRTGVITEWGQCADCRAREEREERDRD